MGGEYTERGSVHGVSVDVGSTGDYLPRIGRLRRDFASMLHQKHHRRNPFRDDTLYEEEEDTSETQSIERRVLRESNSTPDLRKHQQEIEAEKRKLQIIPDTPPPAGPEDDKENIPQDQT